MIIIVFDEHCDIYIIYNFIILKFEDHVGFLSYVISIVWCSAYKYIIPAHGKELVKTDLQIEVPFGTYGRIAPRSGLAWKNHIDVGAGVIDADYRYV